MASTVSPPVLHSSPVRFVRNAHPGRSVKEPTVLLRNRRQLLVFLTTTTALTGREPASNAEDIPLFGLRKKLKRAEEEAVDIVKEAFETAENGLETAERGIATAEKEIESFGALAQAGAVAGAEFLGVVVGTSIVNEILGPEAEIS